VRRQPPPRTSKPERLVIEAPRFAKSKRRFPPRAQLEVDDHVKQLVANPLAGEPKTGALKGVRVVKFRLDAQQVLLAYQFDEKRNAIEILDVAPHENFYRDLQRYR
jgi:mRNA interferase RelE/StbE